MTEEQLQAIRERWSIWQAGKGDSGTAALDLVLSVPRLLAYVDFLQKLIHDLKSESTAYQRGLEDGKEAGIAAERKRCIDICATIGQAAGESMPQASWAAYQCLCAIETGSGGEQRTSQQGRQTT